MNMRGTMLLVFLFDALLTMPTPGKASGEVGWYCVGSARAIFGRVRDMVVLRLGHSGDAR
jgi:hypothetical protein